MNGNSAPRYSYWAETLTLFVALPIVLAFTNASGHRFGFYALVSVTAYVFWQLKRDPEFELRSLVTSRDLGDELPGILLRFLIGGSALTILVWLFAPHLFLSFPKGNPQLWGIVMLLYPILSVFPQEIIYRAFLWKRCQDWRPGGRGFFVVLSTLSYAWVHIIYLNAIAPLLTLAGGLLFVRTFLRNRTLLGVTIEHALWGNLILTIGLGRFFYSGAIGQ